jgi:GNAT superfamily N-acetyltransferase
MSTIEIIPLENTKKNIKKFVKFAWKIYEGNPYWVPPLIIDQVERIVRGPYHEVGVLQPFLALRDGQIVGRIIAHYDRRHNEYFGVTSGRVGFFECINDKDVSRALFSAAEQWLKEQGMDDVYGPYNFLMYDPSGLLLDDYDNVPPLELGYNPPYYPELFEDWGFAKTRDWYAYLFTRDNELPSLFYKFHKQVEKKAAEHKDGLSIRNLDLKHYDRDRDLIQVIFNRAWENNWGHYPFTDTQIEAFGKDLKLIAKEELILFAFYDDKPAGFILSVPDANLAIRKANGRLLPLGIFKILLGMRKVHRNKTFLMGVLPEYRRRGLDVYFYVESIARATKLGYTEADMSLIVEDNVDMINALEHLGARRYKTYRFYSKPL